MRNALLGLFLTICLGSGAAPIWAQGGLDQRVAELSKQIAVKIEADQKKTIAILEFVDLQGNVTDFGRYLAEELITNLYETGRFKVIERQLLNRIISEQKLSLTGIVDPASAKKLGSILGVDAIVSGSIADRGQSMKVNARLISTQTGEIFSAASAEIVKDQEVTALMKNGAASNSTPEESKAASPNSAEKKAPMKVVVGVFSFELQSCKLVGEELTCSINISNDSEEDRTRNLFGGHYGKDRSSRAMDTSGREFEPFSVWVGNSSSNYVAKSILVSHVSVKIGLNFKDVPSDILSLSILRVTFNGKPNDKVTYADFRNVPIVK